MYMFYVFRLDHSLLFLPLTTAPNNTGNKVCSVSCNPSCAKINIGTPKTTDIPLGTSGKVIQNVILDVPILKHFRVHINTKFKVSGYTAIFFCQFCSNCFSKHKDQFQMAVLVLLSLHLVMFFKDQQTCCNETSHKHT